MCYPSHTGKPDLDRIDKRALIKGPVELKLLKRGTIAMMNQARESRIHGVK